MSIGALLLLVFIIVRIYESVAKKKPGQGAPGQGAPRQVPPGQGAPGEWGAGRSSPTQGGHPAPPRPSPEVRLPRPQESASVLLPDDLWAVLTGGQIPPAPRLPHPHREQELEEDESHAGVAVDQGEEDRFGEDRYEDRFDEDRFDDELPTTLTGEPLELRGRKSREVVVRGERALTLRPREGLPGREEREIVSYDDYIPSDRRRHIEFHRRIDAEVAARAESRARSERARAARQRELQRAIILREVLGPPGGLD